jgi:hypothetical protein
VSGCVASRRELIVGCLLIVIRGTLIGPARSLVAIPPRLSLVTRRQLVLTSMCIAILGTMISTLGLAITMLRRLVAVTCGLIASLVNHAEPRLPRDASLLLHRQPGAPSQRLNAVRLDDQEVVRDADNSVRVCVGSANDEAVGPSTVPFHLEGQPHAAVRPGALAAKRERRAAGRRIAVPVAVVGARTFSWRRGLPQDLLAT